MLSPKKQMLRRRLLRAAMVGAVITLGLSSNSFAQTSIWTGGDGNWSSTVAPGWTTGGVPNGTGVTATINALTASTNITQDIVTAQTVGTISYAPSTGSNFSMTVTPTNGLILNQDGAGAGTATISNTNASTGTTNALILAAGTLTLNDNLLVSNTSGSTNTTGAIQIASTLGGTGNLTLFNNASAAVSATSSIRLSGTNTFSGTVLVQKGTVTFNNASAFGNLATNTITLGQSTQGSATLLTTANNFTVPNNIIVASGTGGTLTIGSTSTATTNNQTYSGSITMNGDLSLSSVTPVNATTQNYVVLSGAMSGSGALTKVGVGYAQLAGSGNNSYNGTTTISSGVLNLNKSNNITAINGNIVINGGALTFSTGMNNTIVDTASVTISSGFFGANSFGGGGIVQNETIASIAASGTGNITSGGGTLTVSGLAAFSGDASYVGNSGGNAVFNTLSLTDINATTGGGSGAVNAFVLFGNNTTNLHNTTVGAGGLSLNNSIIVLRKGTNTGTLQGSRLNLNGNVTTSGSAATSIIEDTGYTATTGTIAVNLTGAGATGTVARTFTIGATAPLTVSIPIDNGVATGSLVKDGAGAMTLSAANTYTGSTTITAGTLNLSGAGSLGAAAAGNVIVNGTLNISAITPSDVTLGTARVLSGDGTIVTGATKTLIATGTLAPGNGGVGSLDVTGNFSLSGTPISNFEITGAATFDQLNVTGTMSYAGALNINTTQNTGSFDLFGLGTAPSGDFSSIVLSGAFNGALTNSLGVWTGTDGGVTASFNQATGDLTFTAIPEPSTLILGSLAGLGLIANRLRRRRLNPM